MSFIYINGYPGVGKLTIARQLSKLFPRAKVLDNHLLIDPVAAIFDRTAEEYQPTRQKLAIILEAIATAETIRENTLIFTDSQSSSELGTSAARDYKTAAESCGLPFLSVILHCGLEENLNRAMGSDRGNGSNTKLTDLEIIQAIREKEDLHRFRDTYEMELDVTNLSPNEAATHIYEHVNKILQNGFDENRMDT
ncbi:hypothetical protein F5Y16DRAFT_400409 [Xylariaceae sp. FL0255]|nr:hypothetical protein F5Y16DRAFT_400409 [Xylariaceae sp. FL0255]